MTISFQQQELVDLLLHELAVIAEADHGVLEFEDTSARLLLLEEFEAYSKNIGNAADLVGLKGVVQCCNFLQKNFQFLTLNQEGFPLGTQALIQSWVIPMSNYLQSIGQKEDEILAIKTLLDFLGDTSWPQPMSSSELADINDSFGQSSIFIDQEEGAAYPENVTADMISITIPVDINPELLKGLLIELPSQVAAFDRAVEQYLITEDDVQLRVAQRVAHTLKGAANVVGIQGMANLMHYVEDVLELSAKKDHKDQHFGFILQDSADCLSSISEFLSGLAPEPKNVESVMQAVLDSLKSMNDEFCDKYAYDKFSELPVEDQVAPLMDSEFDDQQPTSNDSDSNFFHLEDLIASNDMGLESDLSVFKTDIPILANDTVIDLGVGTEVNINDEVGFLSMADKPIADKPIADKPITDKPIAAEGNELEEDAEDIEPIEQEGVTLSELIPLLDDVYHRPSLVHSVTKEKGPAAEKLNKPVLVSVPTSGVIKPKEGVSVEGALAASPLDSNTLDSNALVSNALNSNPLLASSALLKKKVSADVASTIESQKSSRIGESDDTGFDTPLTVTEGQAHELLRLTGESQIGNTQVLNRIETLSVSIQSASNYQGLLRQLSSGLERLADTQTAIASAALNLSSQEATEEFDPLELERHNELNSFSSQLQEVTTDAYESIANIEDELKALKNLVLNQRQIGFEAQDLLLHIQMLPVSAFASRFNRCVRQATRLTYKKASFEIYGEEIMVDTRVMSSLIDPIMHLLRNAVDHGLESFEGERVACGKPEVGTITLSFSRVGETIVIKCSDDGKGLDKKSVERSARERNLLGDSQSLTEAELYSLILTPGFSTRREVTQTSGRGVGLDVVSEHVRLLKGTLSISSEEGLGTTFTIVAPMSILSAHTIVAQVGESQLSLVSRSLEQVVYVEQGRLMDVDERSFYRLLDEPAPLPVFRLDEIALLPFASVVKEYTAMVITETKEGERCGVLVESITTSEEQIVKPLGRYAHKVPGIIGAAILGDGKVSPVLDLCELPGLSLDDDDMKAWREHSKSHLADLMQESVQTRPMALVVDDSLSSRRSIAQFVGDMGMEVFTAKDGFEAIQIIEERKPSLILVDLEMPRMNGLELTSHLKASPETQNIPIIMITSRSTEKHKKMARSVGVNTYLNKPWTDEELLSSIQAEMS